MKHILLVATGGTIASEQSENGLVPGISARHLLESVPEIGELCRVDAVQAMNLDSTDMTPGRWLHIAARIREAYAQYDGFVITHGTDTMAYTAAALSYLIQNADKPVVLTGAQRSIFAQDTDARRNMMDAFAYACEDDSSGVTIVFDGKAILGTRARKLRTRSRNAFESIDYPPLAQVRDGKVLRFIRMDCHGPVQFSDRMEDKVAMVKLVPGMDARILADLRRYCRGLVVEGFGVGGVPDYGDGAFRQAFSRWAQEQKPVVMTTQVPYEGSDMALYEVGRRAQTGESFLEAYTMTSEATVVKLMWILGQTRALPEIRRMFYTPIAHDLLWMA